MNFDEWWAKNKMKRLLWEDDDIYSHRVAHEAWHEGSHNFYTEVMNTPRTAKTANRPRNAEEA